MIGHLVAAFQKKLAPKLGLDGKVVSGLFNRFITMALGPIGSALIVLKLDITTQGIYYLFLSILGMRSFFELGINLSVTQVAAHEKVRSNGYDIVKPECIIATSHWMNTASLCFGSMVGIGGAVFLHSKGFTDISVMGAWICFIGVSTYQFSIEHQWAILTGADYVKESNTIRLQIQLLLYLIQWSLLLIGCGLLSFAIASLAAVIAQQWLLKRKFPWLLPESSNACLERVKHHKKELVRLVKRTSQTFLTGYFVFQIQQPICFHFLGASGSAKLGFTQMIGSALLTMPLIWIQSSFPKAAADVANGNINEAWIHFKSAWLRTIFFVIICFVGAIIASETLRLIPRFSERLMSSHESMLLFIGLGIQTISLGLTYWPRTYKKEPFVVIAYVQMVATPVLLWFSCSQLGLIGVSWATVGTWAIGAIGIFISTYPFLPRKRTI